MSNKEKAYELSKLLRYIAGKIEKNPELINNLKIEIKIKDADDKIIKKKPNEKIKLYDLNDNELLKKLKKESIKTLKTIISENNLDSSKSTLKIKDKDELINFIMKRLHDRYYKGESFNVKNNNQ